MKQHRTKQKTPKFHVHLNIALTVLFLVMNALIAPVSVFVYPLTSDVCRLFLKAAWSHGVVTLLMCLSESANNEGLVLSVILTRSGQIAPWTHVKGNQLSGN